MDEGDLTVLIHFEGWNQRYDEWLSMYSEDIRPSTRHSERSKGKTRRYSEMVSGWCRDSWPAWRTPGDQRDRRLYNLSGPAQKLVVHTSEMPGGLVGFHICRTGLKIGRRNPFGMKLCHAPCLCIAGVQVCHQSVTKVSSMSSLQTYKLGDYVFAKWSDCRMYPARVTKLNQNGRWRHLVS